jgi:hypothetical protein
MLPSCAAEVVDAAREWWPESSSAQRGLLAGPLKTLAVNLSALDERGGVLARPGPPMVRRGLVADCRRVTDLVRRCCPPEGAGQGLWSASARLAFALVKVDESA